jgi:hypothetical protein
MRHNDLHNNTAQHDTAWHGHDTAWHEHDTAWHEHNTAQRSTAMSARSMVSSSSCVTMIWGGGGNSSSMAYQLATGTGCWLYITMIGWLGQQRTAQCNTVQRVTQKVRLTLLVPKPMPLHEACTLFEPDMNILCGSSQRQLQDCGCLWFTWPWRVWSAGGGPPPVK